MAPWFTNKTCDSFHPVSKPCTLGNYVRYAVNVSSPDQVSKTIAFASENNIRLVIRNTGHDYSGFSTGAGAIAIWTHHLKDREIIDYKSSYYQGKAIKLGAGAQGIEAYELAHDHNLQVVGGECPTVGIAGGYSQGGGHSALASRYGLAADQVLMSSTSLPSDGTDIHVGHGSRPLTIATSRVYDGFFLRNKLKVSVLIWRLTSSRDALVVEKIERCRSLGKTFTR